ELPQLTARDAEQERAERRGPAELRTRLDAREERALRQVVGLIAGPDLDEAMHRRVVPAEQQIARIGVAGCQTPQQVEILLRSRARFGRVVPLSRHRCHAIRTLPTLDSRLFAGVEIDDDDPRPTDEGEDP